MSKKRRDGTGSSSSMKQPAVEEMLDAHQRQYADRCACNLANLLAGSKLSVVASVVVRNCVGLACVTVSRGSDVVLEWLPEKGMVEYALGERTARCASDVAAMLS